MKNIEIRNTKNKGKGIYALVHFEPNQVILGFKGKIINSKTVDELPTTKTDLLLQIYNDTYLDLSGDLSIFLNHNCSANTGIRILAKSAFLISTRTIQANEELCFDYSTTSTDTLDEWSMQCKCGAWNCRKVISGFQYLPEKEKERYLKMNIVPDYVLRK